MATGLMGSTVARAQQSVQQNQVVSSVPAAFTPNIDGGIVYSIAQAGTWMVAGGTFTSATQHGSSTSTPDTGIVAFDQSTGALDTGFAPVLNGIVESMRLSGGHLFITGTFTLTGAVTHDGLATLNPTTGALDPYMNIQLTGHHNYNGSGANGAVGGRAMDISPDGTRASSVGATASGKGAMISLVLSPQS